MKHGLLGLSRSIARDFGQKGVRCNAICSGRVLTEMAGAEMAELVERKNLASVKDAYAFETRVVPMGHPLQVMKSPQLWRFCTQVMLPQPLVQP